MHLLCDYPGDDKTTTFCYSVPHEESRKIANKRDVMSNHCNTLDLTKRPLKTSSLAQMNGACHDTARKLQKVSVYVK